MLGAAGELLVEMNDRSTDVRGRGLRRYVLVANLIESRVAVIWSTNWLGVPT